MKNHHPSPLVLQLRNPKRRMSSVNIPLLLFVASATEQLDPDSAIQHEWRSLLSAAIEQASSAEHREVLRWLNASLEHARIGCRILLKDQEHPRINHDQVVRIYNRVEEDIHPEPSATTYEEQKTAEHFRLAPRHFTRSITDPLVLMLERIRLALNVGERSKPPNTCEQCAYMAAMLGDLDPECPLCELEQRPIPVISTDPRVLIHSILKACDPGATMENLSHS